MGDTARTAIVVAIIGLAGTLGAALMANWNAIFAPKPAPQPAKTADVSRPPVARTPCVVRLATPGNNAVLPQRRLDKGKVEAVWLFGWRDCPEASRYHLYVIGPGAKNPVVDDETLTAATFQYRQSYLRGVTRTEGWTWKVRAFADGQWGEWSEARLFSVAAPN